MDGPVAERLGKRVVHEPMLIEEREPVEARALDDDLEVVAPARAILDTQILGVGERVAQERLETVDGHAVMVLTRRTYP